MLEINNYKIWFKIQTLWISLFKVNKLVQIQIKGN